MRERLYFKIDDDNRKLMNEVLKNEQKFSKKYSIYNINGEIIAKSSKFDVYPNYVDFYLDDYIEEGLTQTPGAIKSITFKEVESLNGKKFKKIDTIIA